VILGAFVGKVWIIISAHRQTYHQSKVSAKRVHVHRAASIDGLKRGRIMRKLLRCTPKEWMDAGSFLYFLSHFMRIHLENVDAKPLVGGEQGNFYHRHNNKLQRAGFADDGSQGNYHCHCSKVSA
jgi:hypothetical protein